MFTGIVEKKAKLEALKPHRGGRRLWLSVPPAWARLPLGTSLSVDGACLTVCGRKTSKLSFDLLKETLKKTRFSGLRAGDPLNLERAMRAGRRLEGHIVQGHVDGVGRVLRVLSGRCEKTLVISFPKKLKPYMLPKGSVAVNGVSLTVGRVIGRGDPTGRPYAFWVHVIPLTLRKTNLGLLKPGDRVNLESDALLKFFHQLTSRKGHYKLKHSE